MKKLLALIMVAAMVLALVPMTAMADATVDVSTADDLIKALGTEFSTLTGVVTINIKNDIDMTGKSWTANTIGHNQKITINGNGKTITGLTNMLFSGSWGGVSLLTINDLTLKNANIVFDPDDVTEKVGVGAFIGVAGALKNITFNNCHLLDSHVEGGHWTGGFVGTADGYDGSDGPVFETVTYKNCSVKDSTIKGKGSVGGIIGHGSRNAWTQNDIIDCVVTGNTITSTGSSKIKAGDIVGTVGVAGTPSTSNGVTKTGGLNIDAIAQNNTTTSGGETVDRIYGRFGSGGVMEITGGYYDTLETNNATLLPDNGTIKVADSANFLGDPTPTPEATPIPEAAPIPETGDGMGLFVFAGLALISMLGMVVLKKREQF